ncbi:hypothetical protein C8J57DRAFT_1527987 [Mycena rebaudengoi]|nr:hypothetical protein C8J57DRAFT_1527987 [Mycena rebaudengoi]
MANKNGEVYAPNYSVAVSAEDEIVPASVVFEFEHPEFSPTNRIFREGNAAVALHTRYEFPQASSYH